MGLGEDYLKNIETYIQPKSTIEDFVKVLESGGVSKSKKIFKELSRKEY